MFAGIFGRGNDPKGKSVPFGSGLSVFRDTFRKDRYFAEGNHSKEFQAYWEHLSDYTEDLCSDGDIVYVSAKDIEGIYLNDDEVQDPAGFWGRRTGGTQESFTQIAGQVPRVRSLLDAGKSLDQICMEHPELESCVDIYYRGAPSVKSLDDFYVFVDNGRHRTLAAQAIRGKIPVRVIGRIRRR